MKCYNCGNELELDWYRIWVFPDGNQFLGNDIDEHNPKGAKEVIMEVCWVCHADQTIFESDNVPYHFYEIG